MLLTANASPLWPLRVIAVGRSRSRLDVSRSERHGSGERRCRRCVPAIRTDKERPLTAREGWAERAAELGALKRAWRARHSPGERGAAGRCGREMPTPGSHGPWRPEHPLQD